MSSIIMTMTRTFKRSPVALALLALLYEAPMHPYRMQQLVKERGKDKIINVQRRASLYQTIGQLERAGLIRIQKTVREARRPDRTIYELTDDGRLTFQRWLREALSTPAQEFPEFPAAISFLPLLTPEDALRQLEKRAAALVDSLARMNAVRREAEGVLPRLFLLEDEYLHVTLDAELAWVRGLIDDLGSGRLTWSEEWLRKFMASEEDES
jgi:DNA-binding PadR family transcriptional regulator